MRGHKTISEAHERLAFRHTHRADIRLNGSLLIVNPEGVYGHLSGRSPVALVNTEKRAGRIVEI